MSYSSEEYTFQRGYAVLLSAASHFENGQWVPDPGQQASLKELRELLTDRGFDVIRELGLEGSAVPHPTTTDILQLFEDLESTDFTQWDALLVVIASHGTEGCIFGWPTSTEPAKPSGPISLRESIFSKFKLSPEQVQAGDGSVASRTLHGKPKLFLIDACREAGRAQDGTTYLQHPITLSSVDADDETTARLGAPRIFAHLRPGDVYQVAPDPQGESAVAGADFLFGFATLPFNRAGTAGSSLFLGAVRRPRADSRIQ